MKEHSEGKRTHVEQYQLRQQILTAAITAYDNGTCDISGIKTALTSVLTAATKCPLDAERVYGSLYMAANKSITAARKKMAYNELDEFTQLKESYTEKIAWIKRKKKDGYTATVSAVEQQFGITSETKEVTNN